MAPAAGSTRRVFWTSYCTAHATRVRCSLLIHTPALGKIDFHCERVGVWVTTNSTDSQDIAVRNSFAPWRHLKHYILYDDKKSPK